MKNRCYNPNFKKHQLYFDKGIKVCDEWKNNFMYWLGIISNILQIENYNLLLKDKTNNELMKELQNQDKNYLEKIVKQNEEIIAMLKKM